MARRGAQLRGLEAAEIKRWGALVDSLRIILRDVFVRMKREECGGGEVDRRTGVEWIGGG
jgi:hypothetical protein